VGRRADIYPGVANLRRWATAEASDPTECQRELNQLRGVVANFGFSAAAQRLRGLEHTWRALSAPDKTAALRVAQAEVELAQTRVELEELRREIRAARSLERERRRASPPAASRAERERDRRLGAASERASRARESLPTHGTLPPSGPLAPGDPVVAPALGVRGIVAEIAGREAVVLGLSGQRIRIPLDRLQPDLDARKVRDLATLGFIEHKANVAFLGPPGVGKLTVAEELSKLSGHKVFHNHLTEHRASAV